MFYGAVPVQCIEQIVKICDFGSWGTCYVCCSGTFRIEKGLTAATDGKIVLHSNDVSLLSGAIGALLTGQEMPVIFKGDFEFIEAALEDKPGFDSRCAGILVAATMAKFNSKNLYDVRMRASIASQFDMIHGKALKRVESLKETCKVAAYHGRDWRVHFREAIATGAGIAAFPPFFKGDYEKMFAFLHNNVDWPAPSYDLYDPAGLPDLVREIHASGVPYCILTDGKVEGLECALEFRMGRKVPHYCYAQTERSSYRVLEPKTVTSEAFKFETVDAKAITRDSKVEVTMVAGRFGNYVKDICIQAGLVYSAPRHKFLVTIDGKLLGALCFRVPMRAPPGFGGNKNREKLVNNVTEILSDPVLVSDGRLAKLCSMLGTARSVIRPMDLQAGRWTTHVTTSARSDKPVSMKYRGPFKLAARRETPGDPTGKKFTLAYMSTVREGTQQDVYREWWDKYRGR